MDREGLKSIYPSLGPVRSIQDIKDRIADLARKAKPGEWIVTMPIGDPPYYFNVPEILAVRHDQRVRGARRRQRTPARLQGRLSRWLTHDAFGVGVQPELEDGGWGVVGPADRGLGRMARRARARRRLAQDNRSHRRHRKQSS